MQSIGRAKHTVLMVTGSDLGPWPLTILQIVFIGIKWKSMYHYTSEGVFYIGGRGFVCQIIEPVTFARCAVIFALWNIALLGGYLDTRRNI